MTKVVLGRTGITVEQNGFGALPVQRTPMDDAVKLLRRALDNGFEFFDTARAYTDSEDKLGRAFEGKRDSFILATKSHTHTVEGFWINLEESLRQLRTDYVDIYQFHNPSFCPKPDDGTGLYEAMLKAREQGKLRFIGITNHRMDVAREAVLSGLYDTLQFPLSYLSTEDELELVRLCKQRDVGFIGMKGLSGGLITRAAAACAWVRRLDNVVPIWGIQRESELDEFISFIKEPPELVGELLAAIESDRAELKGDFCRACGYCMPCPVGIEINTCARASRLLRRAPRMMLLSPEGQAKMNKIKECLNCGLCASKCPYGLNTPELLRRNYKDYIEVLAGKE